MGPASNSGANGSDLPSRPKFSWDLRNVPWTDGKGNQEQYAKNVELWVALHDKLPDSNNNKIPEALQGIMLQSQLFGRARDLVKKIPDDVIQSDEGVAAIVGAIYKRDALAVLSEVYHDFNGLLSTKRGATETFKNFELRFEAEASKFNAHSEVTKLPESLLAFILLANSNVDNGQRVSVLAAASPKELPSDTSTTSDYLESVSYDSIASVVRQCDQKASDNSQHNPLRANHVSRPGKKNSNKKKLSPEDFAEMKSKSKCRTCNNFGHWSTDHNSDGTLKPGVPSTTSPPGTTNNDSASSSKKAISFHMGNISCEESEDQFMHHYGPLLDDGAPYSGIGEIELKHIQTYVCPLWDGNLEPLPDTIADRPYWQYGTGKHSSQAKRILGSVMLTARSDSGDPVSIRHLVIAGSSQWIIGRNVTRNCDILHLGTNVLRLPKNQGSITIIDKDFHSYLPYNIFCSVDPVPEHYSSVFFCAAMNVHSARLDWKAMKKIVDKVHNHVCGHASFSDIKTLLERNNLFTDECAKYLTTVLDQCNSCIRTSEPKPARKVSLSSISRTFNDTVCVDHLFLDSMPVFHIMDSTSRYSVGAVVESTGMEHAVEVFESLWLSPFWNPHVVLCDQAFNNEIFSSFLRVDDIELRPLPPRRHNKNVLESKHKVIRDIYIRIKHHNSQTSSKVSPQTLVQQALRISNDLYGSDTMSANELAKGYTRPLICSQLPVSVPQEIVTAHQNLVARRKLCLILKSKATNDEPVRPGDLVEIYIKLKNGKRGEWTAPRPVLSYDRSTNTVSVPGANGKTVRAAIEDVRPALRNDALAQQIQVSIDEIQDELASLVETNTETQDNDSHRSYDRSTEMIRQNEDEDSFSINDEPYFTASNDPGVGDKIEVFWPLEDAYFPGVIASIDENGLSNVLYDDGDEETLDLTKETWNALNENETATQPDAVTSNDVVLAPGKELTSVSRDAIEMYYNQFKHSEFLLNHAEGLPEFVTQNAYAKEESSFLANAEKVHVSNVPKDANVITSHVLYKVKQVDDGTKILKARIAPHGNKDREKNKMKTDSATCPPIGMRILFSLASMLLWTLMKIDFESAFLQTGPAKRSVYVVPPKECAVRCFYWLLLTAAYGLVNANAKWQEMSDNLLFDIGFVQVVYVPQLFYMPSPDSDLPMALAVKVVDDILFAGNKAVLLNISESLKKSYKLGTIVHGPGSFSFNGLNICQMDDCSITVSCDERLMSIEPYPITRLRRKQIDEPLNEIELASFRSLNGMLGWIGITASPFCAFASSHLQQKLPNAQVRTLVAQTNMLRQLKKLGTVSQYKRPDTKGQLSISIMVFADAGRSNENGQLGFIAGLLIGPLAAGSVFHVLSWTSQKSKRPVKSIGAAETLSAGSAIDEGKLLAKTYHRLFGIEIDLMLAVDSNDLYETISTCRVSTDKSIRADISVIRYEFETHNLNCMVWIPGRANLADPLTKPDSPLCLPLQLTLHCGELSLDHAECKMRRSTQCTG